MIPKVIHYIWLGNKPKNKLSEACILSWKLLHPDFEIIEWNEKNLDIEKIAKENKFFNECKKRNLWAFMADYLRVKILYENGGIYIDTDVQAIKNITPLLDKDILLSYEYDGNNIGTGTIGAKKKNEFMKKILDFYDNEIMDSKLYIIPDIFKFVLNNYDKKINILPMEVLAPYNFSKQFESSVITNNTYTIHWFDSTWTENKQVSLFLQTKHIKNPVKKFVLKTKKLIGYYKRKIKRIKINKK